MKDLLKIPFIILALIFTGSLFAQDTRSDSLDILHYHIHLDITDLSGQHIEGYTDVRITPKVNSVSAISLDLLKLNVDSVIWNQNALSYTYNDTLLAIALGQSVGMTDTLELRVYYGGSPQKDVSNWGGFYFQSGYAFNLGVGFQADPHNFGRVWFPCFDNFVERSTYSFEIITSNNRKAYCNGELISEQVISGDTIMRSWEMKETIPTYLACVAVGPYVDVRWNYSGIQRNIPVQIAVRAADSNKLKGSFVHLDDAMDAYEQMYGPYRFNKVGYSIVPFNSGAMEHATNIAYPYYAVNGGTGNELLMAHELSHMWWGDLVTCDRQEDMWINEGWASYSEDLFLEHVYGRERYIESVKANHLNVIQYAHIREGQYRAVSGVPHEYTYGMHVYDKGATVAHNLRAYMGDANFFPAIRQFMDENQFSDVNSALIRDKFTAYSGIDLTDFFDDWVLGPGYTNISIDSFKVLATPGLWDVTLYVTQKKRGTDHFFNSVPVEVFLYSDLGISVKETIMVSGEHSVHQVSTPFNPAMVALNTEDLLAMAVTADQQWIKESNNLTLENAKMEMTIDALQADSLLLRVEHHWAHASEGKNPHNYRLSDYRYWHVEAVGDLEALADISATIEFDSRNATSGGRGNLDNELLKNGHDSLVLLHREDASEPWERYQHYEKISFPGVTTFGRIELSELKEGDYTYANGDVTIGVQEVAEKEVVSISPNPVSDVLHIKGINGDSVPMEVMIFDTTGKLVTRKKMNASLTVDVSALNEGSYLIYVLRNGRKVMTEKFIVAR